LIFHLIPIVAAGIMSGASIDKFEALLRRQLFGVPYDIKYKVIVNVTNQSYRSSRQVIMTQVDKIKERSIY
jgi:hypothetical protein